MTISTTVHTRAFCILWCFIGPVLSGCGGGDNAEAVAQAATPAAPASPVPYESSASSEPPASPAPAASAAPTTSAAPPASPAPPASTTPAASPEPPASSEPPASTAPTTSATLPTAPISVRKNEVVALNSSASPYFLVVPDAYDASHNTPSQLFIWLHGCGGQAANDAKVVSPGGTQSWLTVSVGGRDGGCWNVGTDTKLVLAALDDVKTRVNVDPRRVTIGGYSSGGNLAYRTAFYNARTFAGVLAENTAPFYGTGSSQSDSIAAAAWKLNVAHLAHTGDATYPIATIRNETAALKAAGFPAALLEQAGTHWDSDTASSGTNHDLRTYLLPFLDAGWRSPD